MVDEGFVIIEEWMNAKPVEPLFLSFQNQKQSFLMKKIGELLAELQFSLTNYDLKETDF
ncbi:hypothetical protein [Bacillus kexueae]|uniref:hypothetical protein n=1 Tax=Aeribacillus kexueae TaxID=2078952 RepID=UPI001FAFCE46|nr:hypothetical protein [Bacillus kexueae]